MSDIKTVRYEGVVDTRRITAKEWEKAGVEGQATVTWDKANHHTVDASKLSEDAIHILKADGSFVFESAESANADETEAPETTGRRVPRPRPSADSPTA